jgi:hypothetical protein
MIREKWHFGSGLIVGIVFAAVFFYYFAPRYTTVESDGLLVKQDKWTGKSWHLVGDQWKETVSERQDWETIDQALTDALQLTQADLDRENALGLLREKYAVLKPLNDMELLERIRFVYFREIVCSEYLNKFLETAKAGRPTK